MKSFSRYIPCALSVALLGCFTVPFRSSGPSEQGGIALAIVGQYCETGVEPDYGDDLVQVRLKVAVTNSRSVAIEFEPDHLRLIAPDRIRPSPVAADSALTVAPGETKVATVRFMNRGSLECTEELKLDPSDSILNASRPVPMPPISFVARDKS